MNFCPFSIFYLKNNPFLSIYNKLFNSSQFLADIIDYFYGLICPEKSKNISKWLFLIGTAVLTFKSFSFIAHAIKHSIWITKHFIDQTKITK